MGSCLSCDEVRDPLKYYTNTLKEMADFTDSDIMNKGDSNDFQTLAKKALENMLPTRKWTKTSSGEFAGWKIPLDYEIGSITNNWKIKEGFYRGVLFPCDTEVYTVGRYGWKNDSIWGDHKFWEHMNYCSVCRSQHIGELVKIGKRKGYGKFKPRGPREPAGPRKQTEKSKERIRAKETEHLDHQPISMQKSEKRYKRLCDDLKLNEEKSMNSNAVDDHPTGAKVIKNCASMTHPKPSSQKDDNTVPPCKRESHKPFTTSEEKHDSGTDVFDEEPVSSSSELKPRHDAGDNRPNPQRSSDTAYERDTRGLPRSQRPEKPSKPQNNRGTWL